MSAARRPRAGPPTPRTTPRTTPRLRRPGDDVDPQPARRRRHPLHLHVVRQQLRQLQRGRRHLRRHDRRRRGRGGRADGGAHPQARQGRRRPRSLAFIIVFVGGLSSVATDAGYLILIPLGAAAFLSVGRHPLAGLAAAYAGVGAVFAVNILITPLDGCSPRSPTRRSPRRRPQSIASPPTSGSRSPRRSSWRS